MAIVQEAWADRREIVGDSADVPYVVFEAADEAEVKAACEGEEGIPEWIGDLKRKASRSRLRNWWKFGLGATDLKPESSGSLCRFPICVKYGLIDLFECALLSSARLVFLTESSSFRPTTFLPSLSLASAT